MSLIHEPKRKPVIDLLHWLHLYEWTGANSCLMPSGTDTRPCNTLLQLPIHQENRLTDIYPQVPFLWAASTRVTQLMQVAFWPQRDLTFPIVNQKTLNIVLIRGKWRYKWLQNTYCAHTRYMVWPHVFTWAMFKIRPAGRLGRNLNC